VPYVNAQREVRTDGVLVMKLAGESSTVPPDHTAYFIGAHPCTMDGVELIQIKNQSLRQQLTPDLAVDHYFSAKPVAPYPNFYEKVTLYAEMISGPARALKPGVNPRTFNPIATSEQESVFLYMDTATTRAGIAVASQRFHGKSMAIVGLGGTGAYVLDQAAKTPVAEIHLFDGDTAYQHNAFRYPGAMSLEELSAHPKKVDYFHGVYSKMRRSVVAHAEMVTSTNVEQLKGFDYVFLCVDKGSARRLIVEALRGTRTQLFDVGMGIHLNDEAQQVFGVCRVTAIDEHHHEHADGYIPMAEADDEQGIYRNNVQIADLNALNAALAVICWKKACGFYADMGHERHMTYTVATNVIANDEGHS
jgi:hypothetical protein